VTKTKSNLPLLLLLFCSLCGEPISVHAQSIGQDTALMLPTVQVKSQKTRQSVVGSTTSEWQKSKLEKLPVNNLAELLDAETGTYIKSYGQGSLATSSVRGGSAGHTLVLWNGLPIQSPMLGQLDLALLPIQTAESITFTKGGNSALWGTGAIGGVINMSNEADFLQKLRINSGTQIGSFGHFQQQLNINLGSEKLQSVTKFSHQQAVNDFNYFLADGLPERQQTNAQLSQQYVGQDLYWKINNRNQLALHFWGQQSKRQIPPTNVQNRSAAHQDDLTARLLLEYKHLSDNIFWNIKTGFFDEHLNYFDDLILLESRSHFRTYLVEVAGQRFWKNHEFLIGNFHTHTRAWSAGYRENIPSEYKTALFTSWKYYGEKWNSQFSLRQEMVDGNLVPIVPAFGFDWKLIPSLTLKGKISRNYRLPTFNDRFWLPGGNPDLLPESGWSQELTLSQDLKKNSFLFNFSLTAFNRNIDNWILWSVREGQSFWSANNITKVWSRGLEPRLSLIFQSNNIKCQWQAGYDYIRSTNQVALDNPKMAVVDQLIYTPIHQAFSSFSLDWKHLHFAYRHHFTGAADGINDPLEAFQVGNVRLQYSNIFNRYKGTLFLNINNIWDADYLVVERRPMPGIHFQTGLNLSFN
jgi:iron complex outermembrane receptor protein